MSGKSRPGLSTAELAARRAAQLLADGHWYDYEKLIRELSRLVPPGVAMRRAERDRRQAAPGGREAAGPRKIAREPEQLIRTGARAIVRDALKNTAFEVKQVTAGSSQQKQIRMVHEPRIVLSDRRRGEYLLPALNGLAERFRINGLDWALEQVRDVAHDNGLHLNRCPKDCPGNLTI